METPETTTPPAAVPVPEAPLILPASMLQRFAHNIVDGFTAGIIGWIISALAVAASSYVGSVVGSALMVVSWFSYLIYFLVCESLWQKTLGKTLTHTKVVDYKGLKPSFLRTLGRTLARCIPFDAVSFLFGNYPRGWHDSVSGTLVVPDTLTPEQVVAMDFDAVRKAKGNNAGFAVAVIVGLFLLLSVLGILSSVVLASLNSARERGQDATVRSSLMMLKTEAELYFDKNSDSYEGFCASPKAVDAMRSLSTTGDGAVCNDSAEAMAITAQLPSGKYWCIDTLSSLGIDVPMSLPDGSVSCVF